MLLYYTGCSLPQQKFALIYIGADTATFAKDYIPPKGCCDQVPGCMTVVIPLS